MRTRPLNTVYERDISLVLRAAGDCSSNSFRRFTFEDLRTCSSHLLVLIRVPAQRDLVKGMTRGALQCQVYIDTPGKDRHLSSRMHEKLLLFTQLFSSEFMY